MLRNFVCITCLCFLVQGSARLQAQARGTDKAAADALFDEARSLMSRSEYAQACAKFEASQALDAGVGTSLNLADCYEKSGRTASAWAQFRETVSLARKAGSIERERVARERVLRLEPRLSYLTIVTWKGQDVTVTRDGVTLDAAVLGTAIPVDPGPHEISARAPGKRTFSTRVEVGDPADHVSVTVPILADEPLPSLAHTRGSEAEAPVRRDADLDMPRGAASGGGAQRAIALVTAAVGVAGIATGTVFGLKAASTWNDAKARCNPYPYCTERGTTLSREAAQSGNISTIGFVAGGVGLATFTLLWLTAPSSPNDETPLAFALGPLAIGVYGSM